MARQAQPADRSTRLVTAVCEGWAHTQGVAAPFCGCPLQRHLCHLRTVTRTAYTKGHLPRPVRDKPYQAVMPSGGGRGHGGHTPAPGNLPFPCVCVGALPSSRPLRQHTCRVSPAAMQVPSRKRASESRVGQQLWHHAICGGSALGVAGKNLATSVPPCLLPPPPAANPRVCAVLRAVNCKRCRRSRRSVQLQFGRCPPKHVLYLVLQWYEQYMARLSFARLLATNKSCPTWRGPALRRDQH